MDGYDLIAVLRERDYEFKTIILTHCDDFSFAQKAIKIGTSEFILKSNLTSEKLLATFNRISRYIKPKNTSIAGEKEIQSILEIF